MRQRRLDFARRSDGLCERHILPAVALMALGLMSGPGAHALLAQERLTLRERLRLPATVSSEVQFHLIVGTVLREDGTLFVLDHFNKSVRVFDRTGRLVREFGREGSGPGEFLQPTQLTVTAERVFVNDARANRITWFTLEGEFQGDRTYPRRDTIRHASPHKVFPLRGGQLLVDFVTSFGDITHAADYGQSRLVVLDATGRQSRTLAEYSSGHAYAHARSGSNRTTPIGGEYGRGAYSFVSGDSLIVIADAYRGIIQYFEVQREGVRLSRTRNLGWKPRTAMPAAEHAADHRATAARRLGVSADNVVLKYPDFAGVIRSGVLASTGDLWLHTSDKVSGEIERLGEAFQREYLVVPWNSNELPYSVTLPANVLLSFVASDHLLGVHLDSDRVSTLRVYRLERHR